MSGAFLRCFAFGLSVAASFGPIALLIIRTAAARGPLPGCFAALGAALGDFAYALLAFAAGAQILPLLRPQAGAIRILSGLLLIGLAILMMGREFVAQDLAPGAAQRASGTLLPTFMLTMFNPMTVMIFAGFVPQLPLAGSYATAAWLAFGLFIGSLVIQLAFALSGWLMRAALPGRSWRRSISFAGAAGLFVFGVAGLMSSN